MALNHLLLKAHETDKNNTNFTALKDLLKEDSDESTLAKAILALQDSVEIKNSTCKKLPRLLRILTAVAKAELQHSYYEAIILLESISPSPVPNDPNTETLPQLELEVSTAEPRSLFRSLWSYIGNDFESNYKHFVEETKLSIKNKLAGLAELPIKSKKMHAQSALLKETMDELVEMRLEVEKLKTTNVFLTQELAKIQAEENHDIMLLTNQLQHGQETLHVVQDHNRDYCQHIKTLAELNATLKEQNEQLKTQIKKLQQQALATPGRHSLLSHSKSNSLAEPQITHKTVLKPN